MKTQYIRGFQSVSGTRAVAPTARNPRTLRDNIQVSLYS